MFRPIFIIDESFVKEHNVRRQKFHTLPVLCPCEEVNYSKLAIKFSKSLTKDLVFASIRDIIKKIGEYVDRGYEFEVDFDFGILRSKEKMVKFQFNPAKIQKLIPTVISSTMRIQYSNGDERESSSTQQFDTTLPTSNESSSNNLMNDTFNSTNFNSNQTESFNQSTAFHSTTLPPRASTVAIGQTRNSNQIHQKNQHKNNNNNTQSHSLNSSPANSFRKIPPLSMTNTLQSSSSSSSFSNVNDPQSITNFSLQSGHRDENDDDDSSSSSSSHHQLKINDPIPSFSSSSSSSSNSSSSLSSSLKFTFPTPYASSSSESSLLPLSHPSPSDHSRSLHSLDLKALHSLSDTGKALAIASRTQDYKEEEEAEVARQQQQSELQQPQDTLSRPLNQTGFSLPPHTIMKRLSTAATSSERDSQHSFERDPLLSTTPYNYTTLKPDGGILSKKELKRQLACNQVTEQAYLRYLDYLNNVNQVEDYIQGQDKLSYEIWKENEMKKKLQLQFEKKSLKQSLDKQWEESKERLSREKSDQKNSAIPYLFDQSPSTPSSTPSSSSSSSMRFNKPTFLNSQQLSENLRIQIQERDQAKSFLKQQKILEERAYLNHIAMEMDVQTIIDTAAKLEKQQTLLEAWERDHHIKNLKKLQQQQQQQAQKGNHHHRGMNGGTGEGNGGGGGGGGGRGGSQAFHEYIHQNDMLKTRTGGSSREEEELGMTGGSRKFTMSVGYDPRKAKL